jgi:hypothetical protein
MSEDGDKPTPAPPGWFPAGAGRQRWWDGQQWGPFAPSAVSQPPPVPPKRKMGKTGKISLAVLAVLFVPGILIQSVHAIQGGTGAPASEKQEVVVDPADGCQRIYDLTMYIYQQEPSNDVLMPKFRGLHDAAKANDPLLASDLQDIIDSTNATEVSNATGVIFRRCVFGEHITQEQMATLADAAKARAQ